MAAIDDDIARVRDRLDELGEAMWSSAEEVVKEPVIHPRHIWGLIGPAVGEIHGLAAALGWHVEQSGKEKEKDAEH